jgi:hypothetical protein
MKGQPALAFLETLVAAVTPHLPPEVRRVRVRLLRGRLLQVWAVPADAPEADLEYDFVERRTDVSGGSLSTRGPEAPAGIGSWIPLPRAIRQRVEAVDALGLIREAVNRVAPAWPAPHSEVKARTDGGQVVVWFEVVPGHPVVPEIRLTASF